MAPYSLGAEVRSDPFQQIGGGGGHEATSLTASHGRCQNTKVQIQHEYVL
jgi:hypothetical protein